MFPDIANVLHIREALWRHRAVGTASVMVGAGFSRNAEPLSQGAPKMPNWSQMAEALCHPLYPTDDARRNTALREASGTSGFLRLAQEYQIAFGPGPLNDRIRSLVPDIEYRPSDLHKRLLRLRWADIYSTNWDTLLERTCVDVFDRSYDIVRTIDDIPSTTRPRIVKLHGSFPAHHPFIFTEEDYRTYPAKFAPFVNLVQQSMTETIFCLIGFSGDDPNFLHWSGWVRDNLGPSAPKIYLVGWLELSAHRRRMLEARNVMPVDLSTLPAASSWPPDLKHRYAMEWFIAALELGKPYGATHWPDLPTPPPPPPAHLGSLPANTQPLPAGESLHPAIGEPPEARVTALRQAMDAWAQNRRLYPGWLIAPERVRERLHLYLGMWNSEFSLLPRLSPWERLSALCELAWRMDRTLLPFPADQEDAAFAALVSIDPVARTVGGEPMPKDADWPDMMTAANGLALALLRNARRSGDRARWDRAEAFLASLRVRDREIDHALSYEACLWHIATGDLSGLMTRLDDWAPASRESLWALRKAGLLAEMREHARACALLETTLGDIRKTRRRDIDDLASLSLEGWALYLALAYSGRSWRKGPSLPKDLPEPFERWRELALVDCDAFGEYQTLKREVSTKRELQPEFTINRGFDLDHTSATHHLGRAPSPTVVAAYQMVLLAEETGIPAVVDHMNLFADGLKAAARALADEEPWLASQFTIRMGSDDKLFDEIFSRTRIARLPQSLVPLLRDTLLRRAAFAIVKATAGDRDAITMVASALEVLSRVAVRMTPQELGVLFQETLEYYSAPLFRRQSTFLGQPLANLLKRILETWPTHNIAMVLPALFALPLPHQAGPVNDDQSWHDPVGLLPGWFKTYFADERAAAWESIIAHLLIAAKGADAIDRETAVYRLFKLSGWQLLRADEIETFAAALWDPKQRDEYGLPQHTRLRSWVLLLLPEQEPGQAKQALGHYVAERARKPNGGIHERLAAIGETIQQLDAHDAAIAYTAELQADLSALIGAWAAHRTPLRHPIERMMNRRDEHELEAVEGVATILRHITPDADLLEKVWTKASVMDDGIDGGVHAFVLYPMLARRWPNRRADLADRLRHALFSDQDSKVQSAVRGLYQWIEAEMGMQDQPILDLDDLAREIGIAIATRRIALLRQALEFARWIFREGPPHLRALIARDCDHGLAALLEEGGYDRHDQPFDVPAIRAACFCLALAMSACGYDKLRGVAGWLAAATSDPLPEVRNAELRKVE